MTTLVQAMMQMMNDGDVHDRDVHDRSMLLKTRTFAI